MKTIYVASKVKYAEHWKRLRAMGVKIVSTWIDDGAVTTDEQFLDLWVRCVQQAAEADCIIALIRDDERLKGALVEIGAALAVRNPVYVVSDCCINPNENGTWHHHPLVTRCECLSDALRLAGYEDITYEPD